MKKNFYAEMFERYLNADKETRENGLKHWKKMHAENKAERRFDLVIFSAEMINAIQAAEQVAEYCEMCNAIFKQEKGLYIFDIAGNGIETFETYKAAAEFAKYNNCEMIVSNCVDNLIYLSDSRALSDIGIDLNAADYIGKHWEFTATERDEMHARAVKWYKAL